MDTSVPVVLLGLIPERFRHGPLGIARSLGRLGIGVHLASAERWAPIRTSRYLSRSFDPGDEPLATLLAFGRRLGGRAVLIALDDAASMFVERCSNELHGVFLFPRQPPGLVRTLARKEDMTALAMAHGIAVPDSEVPSDWEQVERFAARTGFPVVAKAIEPWFNRGLAGLASVVIAEDLDQLRGLWRSIGEEANAANLLLQEYLPGGPETVWMFNGYFDAESECRVWGTGRKLRQHPPYTGMTTLGEARSNPEVAEMTLGFMKAIGYRGILDCGYRHDERDGRYKLLDVNPRVGSTFRLFAGPDGMDVVQALYLDLTGQAVPDGRPVEGRRWWVENHDIASSLQYQRDGRLSLRTWARSLRGVREAAWFAADDPLPFLAMAGASAAQVASRPLRHRAASDDAGRFTRDAAYWHDVYASNDVQGEVYRTRRDRARSWIAELGLPPGTSVLEVGPGDGSLSASLATDGLAVTVVDPSTEMLELTRGLTSGVRVARARVAQLPFAGGEFELTVAVGVLPWVEDAAGALRELARVTAPGGNVLVTSDNAHRLTYLAEVDPWLNPFLRKLKESVKRTLRKAPPSRQPPFFRSPRVFEMLVSDAGLEPVRQATVGFGPFTLFRRELFSIERGLVLHRKLQSNADAGRPLARRTGSHHLILAQRPVRG